jgi:hypothetical protein
MTTTPSPDWVIERTPDAAGPAYMTTGGWTRSLASAYGMSRTEATWTAAGRREYDGDARFSVRERRYDEEGLPFLVEETPARRDALRAVDSIGQDALAALLEIVARGARLGNVR